MWSLAIAVVVLSVSWYVWEFLQNWRVRRLYAHMPGPGIGGFFEHTSGKVRAARVRGDALAQLSSWVKEYGDTYVFCVMKIPTVFTVNADNLFQMFNDIAKFSKPPAVPIRSLYGQSLTGLNSILGGGNQTWLIKRKHLTPFFAKSNMGTMFTKTQPVLAKMMKEMRLKVGSGDTLNVHDQLSTICSALPSAFGYNCVYTIEQPEKIGKLVNFVLDEVPNHRSDKVSWFELLHTFNPESKVSKTIHAIQHLRSVCKGMIDAKRRELVLDDGSDENDIIKMLILANKAAGLTDEDIIDDMVVVYFVVDNMVKQLGVLFIELANHKDVLTKMKKEILDNPITEHASLDKLVYLDQVIKETLRLDPTLQKSIRHIKGPTYLGNYYLPNKGGILTSQWVQHRQEKYFENAHVFNPDRWAPDAKGPDKFAYFPFIAGPRQCLGMHMAGMWMKLILSNLLTHFDMTPVPEADLKSPVRKVNHLVVLRMYNGPYYDFKPVQKLEEGKTGNELPPTN